MQFHFHANESHFHTNGFALRLALKRRHKETPKWPIIEPNANPRGRTLERFLSTLILIQNVHFCQETHISHQQLRTFRLKWS